MIAVIDYGMGNIHSVQKALQLYGAQTLVANSPEQLLKADKAVFPGVGAFDDAMVELRNRGLDLAIKKHINAGKIFLGICLGMQVLFESSQEAVEEKGLGVLKGEVKRFNNNGGLKVPHMGWNLLKIKDQKSKIKNACGLLEDLPESPYVYFCHSYYPQPVDDSVISATCEYGVGFAAVVVKDNVMGVQFHPEKSQKVGLKIIENFLLC